MKKKILCVFNYFFRNFNFHQRNEKGAEHSCQQVKTIESINCFPLKNQSMNDQQYQQTGDGFEKVNDHSFFFSWSSMISLSASNSS